MRSDIRNLMRRLRYRWKAKDRAEVVALKGGPYDGLTALLTHANGTLALQFGEWHGHYDGGGQWHDEPTNGRHKPADAV